MTRGETYAAAVRFHVEVGQSPLHGLGVFATRAHKEGDVVEVCPALEVPVAEITGFLEGYVFESLQGEEFNTILLGYGSLYNHSSKDPNVFLEEHEDGIATVALRDISKGEELCHDYGEAYWSTRDIDPV